MLKLGSKQVDAACEASTELKFRAAVAEKELGYGFGRGLLRLRLRKPGLSTSLLNS